MPRAPFWLLFEIHDDPIWSHPLWLETTLSIPCVRMDVRTLREPDGKFTWAPAAGPADSVDATLRLLLRLIDGFGPHMGPRQRPFRYYIQPAALGIEMSEQEHRSFPNAHRLLRHRADALRSGRPGPWARAGIEANARWTREYAQHLVAELEHRGLPEPLAFILASENGVKDDFGGHLLENDRPGGPDIGWVPEALADPRARDPLFSIDGTNTFAAYFENARCLDGSPVPEMVPAPLGMPSGRHPINHESSERYRGALRRLWEHARHQAFAIPLQQAFTRGRSGPIRLPMVGEYLAATDSKTHPIMQHPGLHLHQMDGYFRCDLQCPDWYGGLCWPLRDEVPFTKDHPGWDTLTNWCVALGEDPERLVALRGKRGAEMHLGLRLNIMRARERTAACPAAPLAPFVQCEEPDQAGDMAAYLRAVRDMGGYGAVVFMPKPSMKNHDLWWSIATALES